MKLKMCYECFVPDRYGRETKYYLIWKVPCYGCGKIISVPVDEESNCIPDNERLDNSEIGYYVMLSPRSFCNETRESPKKNSQVRGNKKYGSKKSTLLKTQEKEPDLMVPSDQEIESICDSNGHYDLDYFNYEIFCIDCKTLLENNCVIVRNPDRVKYNSKDFPIIKFYGNRLT